MDAYVEKGAADADDGRPTPPAGTGHQGPSDPVTTEPSDAPEPSGLSGDGSDVRPAAERAGGGIMALSMPYQVVLAVALAVVGVFACVHLAMVFLHVAPSNTLTKRHGQAVDDWVYPEFEQNWKLFAPNPLQQNVSVEVRAELVAADGSRRTTGWIDLTAQDAEAIRHNPMPSHAQQNELRRAVDFYLNSHSEDHTPNGMRGRLSEEYMRRIAMLRLGDRSGDAERVQLRTVTRAVAAPAWGTEKNDTAPSYRDFPWWPVTDADRPAGVDRSRTEAGR
ncbi:hypothetical protein AMK27_17835 [Streptomyces sp. CB02009]|uniref:DUF5819 family protein n=1 Tax=Streptomyces sp. CB02009 TaxID=1703938 RepID=UPI00093A17F6|nr:DUF5819 family protein [Streptomyces sp. CB02009]OKJ61042.1 hypothetical protein AMK27_17835 [Streptomyces sp. CB02009]